MSEIVTHPDIQFAAKLLDRGGMGFNALAFGAEPSAPASVNATAIQAAIDALPSEGGTVELPGGVYEIDTGLVRTNGRFRLRGAGRRTVELKATAAITMLEIGNDSTTSGSIILENLRLNGNEIATKGLVLTRTNFSKLDSVEIFRVDGPGLDVEGTQDCVFVDLDVRHCDGAGVAFSDHASFDTNSLVFLGGTIERNRGHGVLIDAVASAFKFLGTKFHGRTTADETTPPSVDLIHALGTRRLQIVGCQFAHGNRYGVFLDEDAGENVTSAILLGNTFHDPENHAADAEAWNVVQGRARMIAEANHFFSGSHASYTSRGGDVWIQDDAVYWHGTNHHHAPAAEEVKNDRGTPSRTRPLHGFDLHTETAGQQAFRIFVRGESHPRVDFLGHRLRLGGGSMAPDAVIERLGAGRIAVPELRIGDRVGFFGTAPQLKPEVTGSAGGNAALESLLSALDGLGLLEDSST